MNLLSQIIPGLRETRAPLAIGTLWLTTGWLCYFFAPREKIGIIPTLKNVTKPLSVIPDEILISIAILVVYILGILLEAIGKIFYPLMLTVLFLGLAAIIFFGFTSTAATTGMLILAATIFTLYSLLRAAQMQRQLPDEPYSTLAADAMMTSLESSGAAISDLYRKVRTAAEPDFEVFQELLREDIERTFGDDKGIIPKP